MKINTQATAPRTATAAEPRVQTSGNGGKPSLAAEISPSTQVTLSTDAGLKAGAADSDGDFDASRVKALKAAIDSGSFKVNAEVVADKLIASNVESLSSTRRSS